MLCKKNKIMLTVFFLIGFASLIVGLFVAQHLPMHKKVDLTAFHGTLLASPRAVKAFELTGDDKQPFNQASLKGQWTLLFFGFTECGSICPTTLAALASMQHVLEAKGVKRLPRVVMISVDPARDSLDKLGAYVKTFHPGFYGVSGSPAMIKQLADELGIAYSKTPRQIDGVTSSTDYDVDHSGAIILFNPDGELTAFFSPPHEADALADDYQLISN